MAQTDIKLKSVEELRTGEGTWRAIIQVGPKEKEYQVWATEEYISDYLNLPTFPSKRDVENFALYAFKDWAERKETLTPLNKAILLSNRGQEEISDPNKRVNKLKQQIKTNINLPPSLYKWAKKKSQNEKISLSELIRRTLAEEKTGREESEKWFLSQRNYVQNRLKEEGHQISFMEVSHYLPESSKLWGQGKLLESARNAEMENTGWPIGLVLDRGKGDVAPEQDGIRAEYVSQVWYNKYDYWYLRSTGDFYFARSLSEDNTEEAKPGEFLFFDRRIWRIAEGIQHAIELYDSLEVDQDEQLRLKIGLFGLSGRKLSASNVGRASNLRERRCTANQASWEIEVPLNYLKSDWENFVYDAAKKIFVLFDFFNPNQDVVSEIVEEYKNSKIR